GNTPTPSSKAYTTEPGKRKRKQRLINCQIVFGQRSTGLCSPFGRRIRNWPLPMAGCRGATPARRDSQAGKLAKVIFSASKIEIDCQGSDYILARAVDRGLRVAYPYRGGRCG